MSRPPAHETEGRPDEPRPGVRLGLPADGTGAVASLSRRAGQFVLDIVVAGLIGGLVNVAYPNPPDAARFLSGTGAYILEVSVLTALTGQSLGMRATGLVLVRLPDLRRPDLIRAFLRALMIALLVPALIVDRDNRGLQDRLTGTVVLRL